MPEVIIPGAKFALDIKQAKQDFGYDTFAKVSQSLAYKHGVEIVGQGRSRLVYGHPSRPDRVVALDYQSGWPLSQAEKQLRSFYAHRILHRLYPAHFPDFYSCFYLPFDQKSPRRPGLFGTTRQRMYGRSPGMNPEFNKSTTLIELGRFEFFVSVDDADCNFIIGPGGDLVYLDTINTPDSILRPGKERLLVKLAQHRGLSETATNEVLNYYHRGELEQIRSRHRQAALRIN